MKYLTLLALLALMGCMDLPQNNDLFVKRSFIQSLAANSSNENVIELKKEKLDSIVSQNRNVIVVYFPYGDSIIKLYLTKINLFAPDFKVNTDQGPVVNSKGLYYSGHIIGDLTSMASLSINDGDVTGIVSSDSLGTITIIKERANSNYRIYNSFSGSQEPMIFGCLTQDTLVKIMPNKKTIARLPQAAANGCVSIDFELTYDNYTYFGSTQAATNWILSLFAAVKTIYQNEGINVTVKSVYVWTTPDSYSLNTGTALNQFLATRKNDPNFTGSLGQLIRGRTGGSLSGIAYVGVLCDADHNFSVAEPMFQWAAYPAYSWSVNVITHELGHNLGSPHTHSCSWPGGPIDNCSAQEGSCAPGPNPGAAGGTQMSYCHMKAGVGIKFSNGFGKLPGDLMRANVANSTCLLECGATPPPPVPPVVPAGTNVAKGKATSQSSTYPYYPSSNIVDGIIADGNFNHTQNETNPWVQIDLGASHKLSSIKVYNRSGCSDCRGRTRNLTVIADGVQVYQMQGYLENGQIVTIPLNLTAKTIKFQSFALAGNWNIIHFTEVQVFADGAVNPPIPPVVVCKDTIYKVDSLGRICR